MKFRTWEKCLHCSAFIMYNGFHWVHRDGTANCGKGNAKPVAVHKKEEAA